MSPNGCAFDCFLSVLWLVLPLRDLIFRQSLSLGELKENISKYIFSSNNVLKLNAFDTLVELESWKYIWPSHMYVSFSKINGNHMWSIHETPRKLGLCKKPTGHCPVSSHIPIPDVSHYIILHLPITRDMTVKSCLVSIVINIFTWNNIFVF